VVDLDGAAAAGLAQAHDATAADLDGALGDPAVEAVVIATPGTTHSALIEAAARAGKQIFCEKPLGTGIDAARRSLGAVDAAGVRLSIGFHRRFDPSFRAARERIAAGEIGEVRVLSIVSRDFRVPSPQYCIAFGGMFFDSAIHDLDMARWLLGEEPVELFAMGSCLVDPRIGAAGDVDTHAMVLRTATGRLCQITGGRGAAHGFDQRLEAYGAKGTLQVGNRLPTTVSCLGPDGAGVDPPLAGFAARYPDAYRLVLDEFVTGVLTGEDRTAKGEDGFEAMILAAAARQSARTGAPIRLPAESAP
jgi:myo-inositol 2-dehydrogenase/D-chiro-inositol 1-dehydrogenase